jgi:hypothetical protein
VDLPIYPVIYPLKMVIFHSYVSLPEGIWCDLESLPRVAQELESDPGLDIGVSPIRDPRFKLQNWWNRHVGWESMSVDFQESKRTPWENHRENQGKTWKIIEKTSAFLAPKFTMSHFLPRRSGSSHRCKHPGKWRRQTVPGTWWKMWTDTYLDGLARKPLLDWLI